MAEGQGVGACDEQVSSVGSVAALWLQPELSALGAGNTHPAASQSSGAVPHLGQRAVELHGYGAALVAGAQVLQFLRLLHGAEGAVEARVAAERGGRAGG